MPYNNGSVDVYIDMGVIEHFSLEEQRVILHEARRVLRKNGLAFINMPYMNLTRRIIFPFMWIKNQIGKLNGKKFYQYIYTKKEICSAIKKNEFNLVNVYLHDVRIMIVARKN
jgi:predicted SAM-dependent methyltransferase